MSARARITVDRADLERLTSAATAFSALQAMARFQGIALPRVTDGHSLTLAGDLDADLDALEQAVIRTRRLLGWRR